MNYNELKIEDFVMSGKLYGCLNRANYIHNLKIQTLSDLKKLSDEELLKLPHFGPKCLEEAHKIIADPQFYIKAHRTLENKIKMPSNVFARDTFYTNELDIDRANALLLHLIKSCTLKEVFWIFKTIMYDQVAYWSEDSHSIIYDERRDGKRTNLNIEQANRLQQQLRSILDLYSQSIIDRREFDENYLKDYEFARAYIKALKDMRDKYDRQ